MSVLKKFLEENTDYNEYDNEDILNEKVSTSRVVRSKMSKIKASAGLEALHMAKRGGDPMYKQYIAYRNKALSLKKKLMNKYGRKGLKAAKSKMM